MEKQAKELNIPFYIRHYLLINILSLSSVIVALMIAFSLTNLEIYQKYAILAVCVFGTSFFILLKTNTFYRKYNQDAINLIFDAKPERAIAQIDRILKYPSKNSPVYAILTFNKALAIFYIGFPGDALNHLTSCKMLHKKKLFQFVYFHNTSFFYYFLHEHDLALENYEKAVLTSKAFKKSALNALESRNDLLLRLNKGLTMEQNIEESYQFFLEKSAQSKNLIEKLNSSYFFAKAAILSGKLIEAKESLKVITDSNTNTIYTKLANEMLEIVDQNSNASKGI